MKRARVEEGGKCMGVVPSRRSGYKPGNQTIAVISFPFAKEGLA